MLLRTLKVTAGILRFLGYGIIVAIVLVGGWASTEQYNPQTGKTYDGFGREPMSPSTLPVFDIIVSIVAVSAGIFLIKIADRLKRYTESLEPPDPSDPPFHFSWEHTQPPDKPKNT
jgi:hypothetical protein